MAMSYSQSQLFCEPSEPILFRAFGSGVLDGSLFVFCVCMPLVCCLPVSAQFEASAWKKYEKKNIYTKRERALEWDSLLLLLFRCCYSIYVNVFCENPSTHIHSARSSSLVSTVGRLLLLLLPPPRCCYCLKMHELSLYSYVGTPIHLLMNDTKCC